MARKKLRMEKKTSATGKINSHNTKTKVLNQNFNVRFPSHYTKVLLKTFSITFKKP